MIRSLSFQKFKQIRNALNNCRDYGDYMPKNRLNEKVAIVTGSSYGIGFSIAERIGLEGGKVVICSRHQKNVNEALAKLKSKNIQATGVQCHVTNADDRQKLYKEALDKFGEINILVSNVGVNPSFTNVLDCEESKWDKIFDVNVKSSFLLAKETVPFIRKANKGGKIVFMSSISAYTPFPELGAYSVSKTAVIGLTKAAAQQLAKENIQVNCIAPGLVKTAFAGILLNTERHYQYSMKMIPMERAAEPHEVAGVVSFLVSDDASYITGETITIAGGYSARL